MPTIDCHLPDADATRHLGYRIGGCLRGGDVVGLRGELGAGKTSLVVAIGESLGLTDMCSPSFGIVHEHQTQDGRRLIHVDAWRLQGVDDLAELGWDEWTEDDTTIICVEWADRIAQAMATLQVLRIDLVHAEVGRHASLHWSDQSRLSELAEFGDTP